MIRAALLALASIAAAASLAHGTPTPDEPDKRRIIGILEVRVEGVPAEIAAQFQTDLETQLDSRAYWLAPRARVHELLANSTKWTDGCVAGPCLQEVRVQTGADVVLLAAITGAGTSFSYVVTLMRTDTGQMVSQQAERCEVCTVNEVLTNATLAAVKLLTSLPDELPSEADVAKQAEAKQLAAHAALAATKRRHARAAWVTTLVGIAAAGAGIALYALRDEHDVGLVTAAAGGGLVLGGVVALTF